MNTQDPNWKKDITITLPAYQWLTVHGNACLGLRHPENTRSSRGPTITFLVKLEGLLLHKSLLTPDDITHIHKTGY